MENMDLFTMQASPWWYLSIFSATVSLPPDEGLEDTEESEDRDRRNSCFGAAFGSFSVPFSLPERLCVLDLRGTMLDFVDPLFCLFSFFINFPVLSRSAERIPSVFLPLLISELSLLLLLFSVSSLLLISFLLLVLLTVSLCLFVPSSASKGWKTENLTGINLQKEKRAHLSVDYLLIADAGLLLFWPSRPRLWREMLNELLPP